MGHTEALRRGGATLLLSLSLLTLAACGDTDDTADDAGNNDTNNSTANNATNNSTANNSTANNATANNSAANNSAAEPLEIEGVYDDGFGGGLIVQDDLWIVQYSAEGGEVQQVPSTILTFSNDDNALIVQSPPDDAFTPNQFARQVWTEPDADGAFYYCTVVFGLETLEAAQADTTEADPSDPAQGGCGGFPWTFLTPR